MRTILHSLKCNPAPSSVEDNSVLVTTSHFQLRWDEYAHTFGGTGGEFLKLYWLSWTEITFGIFVGESEHRQRKGSVHL